MNQKSNVLNISSSPHVLSPLTTGQVMLEVILALLPATAFGLYRYGLHAFLIILCSIVTAVLTEFVFDLITKKKTTITDGSAVVTGLLLALSLPPRAPLYLPIIGSLFAILVVKCLFGGLGKNFMNPAVTARCFLLISFSTAMTNYSVDAVSTATPLADLAAGNTVNVAQMYLGYTNGVIGGSALALLIGGLFLWIMGGINLDIPVSCIVAFTAFIAIFGGQGLSPAYLAAQICGGGLLMGAFFMATDPVTSPVNRRGQILYGASIGIIAALFRVFGTAADSFSYAIILGNLLVPFIDKIPIPKPLGYKKSGEYREHEFPKAAVNLTVITLVAGLALSGVYALTRTRIEENETAASLASYADVLPDADSFTYDDDLSGIIEELSGEIYSEEYGRSYVDDAIVGMADDGSVAGYVICVTDSEGFDGDISLSVGFTTDGMLTGISFTTLTETAGMGMRADEDEFKDQFKDIPAEELILNKAGGSTEDNEIDSVSGASVTSSAVVNAVNTAIAFYNEYIG